MGSVRRKTEQRLTIASRGTKATLRGPGTGITVAKLDQERRKGKKALDRLPSARFPPSNAESSPTLPE